MTITSKHLSPPSRQSGAALITGLIFLVVLTMIGITAARMSTLEERMSGNMRDRSIAMQAAEMALRYAEQEIINKVRIDGITNFSADCGLSTGTIVDDGLCYSGAGVATAVIGNNDFLGTIAVATYGTYHPANINGVAQQPRYVIEGFEKYCWTQCEAVMTPGYRITVRAQGANPNTVVWLQAVYKL